jgi:uncharacterized phage-like protein YoqJ
MFFGGAIGADSYALEAAYEFNKGAKLTVVVPGKLEQQPGIAQEYIHLSDFVIELGKPLYLPESYRYRNTYLVKQCDHLIAFFDGSVRSGTNQTINIAKQLNKPLTIVSI